MFLLKLRFCEFYIKAFKKSNLGFENSKAKKGSLRFHPIIHLNTAPIF